MHHPRFGGMRREMIVLVCLFLLFRKMHVTAQPGFTSIDCGIPDNQTYVDLVTGITYVSDVGFIHTGINMNVNGGQARILSTVRSFPDGARNCYTINAAIGSKYLLRAMFLYGNYDGLNTQPYLFELHLGVNLWKKISISNPDDLYQTEVITVATANFLSVCLVNIGSGTPFISGLDVRKLDTTMYYPIVNTSNSLILSWRYNFGGQSYRYPDDPYDRVWIPYGTTTAWEAISTTLNLENVQDLFEAPAAVMSTAATPVNSNVMEFNLVFTTDDASKNSFIIFHFSELSLRLKTDSRVFDIYVNGVVVQNAYTPPYLLPGAFYSLEPLVPTPSYHIALKATALSTLPPLLNALEIYTKMDLAQLPTVSGDVNAITAIMVEYHIEGNWIGDPCAPMKYSWDGLNCSYNPDPQRIISLNLSSRALIGIISSSFADLTALRHLDLSNNNLTGTIPDDLGNLPSLEFLDLSCNNFIGQIPASIRRKSEVGSLKVRFESFDNGSAACANRALISPSPSAPTPSGHKIKNIIISVVSAIGGISIVPAIICAIWKKLCRGRNPNTHKPNEANHNDDDPGPQTPKTPVHRQTNWLTINCFKGSLIG